MSVSMVSIAIITVTQHQLLVCCHWQS